MKDRTKITKESLLSIGFVDGFPFADFSMTISEDNLSFGDIKKLITTTVQLRCFDDYDTVYVDIVDNLQNSVTVPREFEYIDEIKTLLTGLTGKTNFYKKP